MSDLAGKTVLHYHILERLGQGGMGVVYKAHDSRLDRTVAVKFLPGSIAARPEERHRLMIEARAAAALSHPNITTIHAIEEVDDQLFIVMEYVDGRELRGLVEAGPIPPGDVLSFAVQLAEALCAAHGKGVVHRDIKSSNIMVTGSDQVKIMDFGLARIGAGEHLTKIGTTLGTIAYMSPEQARGEEVDHRSDIWSFGVVLYEMLTARLPFRGEYDQATIYLILNEDPTPLAGMTPGLPEKLALVVERALQKEKERRYQSAAELLEDLREFDVRPILDVAVGHEDRAVMRGEVRAYGILMGEKSEAMIQQSLEHCRNLVSIEVHESGGMCIRAPGHTIIAAFEDASRCVACAKATLGGLAGLNSRVPVADRVHYRFGLDYGELIETADGPGGVAVARSGERACFASTDGLAATESFIEKMMSEETGHSAGSLFDASALKAHQGPRQLEGFEVPPSDDRPSIAILPFLASEDAESEAIAEGLRIDITNALMKVKNVFLIAPSSMNHFRGDVGVEVASRLGTRHVLEGNVRRRGERVRVTVQLKDSVGEVLLWSENYDRVLDDSFALQDEIAERVITELDVKLTMGEQARVWRKCLVHPRAREYFYQGVNEFFRSTADSVLTAQRSFERVAELVPASPVGATWTALSLWLQAAHGWTEDREETQALASSWAEKAAAMEDADGQAHTVLGAVLLFDRRYDEALTVARDSVYIRPGCNTANGILANVLLHCGLYNEAIVHVKRAIRIGPIYPPLFLEILSSAYREAGNVDFAIAVGRELVRLVPEGVHGRLLLASALVRGRWLAEARQLAGGILEREADFSLERYLEAQPYRSEEVVSRLREELSGSGLPA